MHTIVFFSMQLNYLNHITIQLYIISSNWQDQYSFPV